MDSEIGKHLAAVVASQPGAPDMGPLLLAVGCLVAAVVLIFLTSVSIFVRRARSFTAGAIAASILQRAALGTIPKPSPPLTASGGNWRVADETQLVVAPNTLHRIRVDYTPDASYIAADVRAVVRARELWWSQSAEPAAGDVEQTQPILEVPATLTVPAGFQKGRTIEWDAQFTLAEDVPSTCGDWHTLSCDWVLAVSIDRPNHPDARFEQPIIVTQPRDRLNAGVIDESEFGRYEEATGASGAIRVDFRVRPAPLDLAAPALVELVVTNDGPAIVGCEVRLEIRMYATGIDARSNDWVIWQALAPIFRLPVGPTELRFDVPAINRPCPDMDLPHGRLRGKLRLVVDTGHLRDIIVERDLALCLEKPVREG